MALIRYIERKDIDNDVWNKCIDAATNGVIYAYAWYLDTMADDWGALILNDYEAVMPLPLRKKFGFCYVYTPAFCNPLGIFAATGVKVNTDLFLNAIPHHFRLWDLNLLLDDQHPGENFITVRRQNFILDLKPGYPSLHKEFRASYKQILNKNDQVFNIRFNIPLSEISEIAKRQKANHAVKESDYHQLQSLYETLNLKSMAETVGIYTADEELLASGLFLKTNKRIYYVLAGNTPQGRPAGASHHLLNAVIRKYAGQQLLLDFEGSDIPGIAFFFEGFGAVKETYFYIHYNNLPWWCRWIKKADPGVPI